MNYEEIILTENTDELYDSWTEYRNNVTDYIIESIEHDYIMKRLRKEEKLRLYETYNIDNMVDENAKPVLAIIGAGGCNDIDIVKLSKYFHLVLVDNDVEKIKSARRRFGLSEISCTCTDMHFWEVGNDDYLMYEALLKDKAPFDEIESFINELIFGNQGIDYSSLPKFDYSVVVGVASQLSVRFAVLAHMYGRYDELYPVIQGTNKIAVDYMMRAICKMTKHQIIVGYELNEMSGYKTYQIDNICRLINDENEYKLPLGNEITVAGSDDMEHWIDAHIEEGDIRVLLHRALVWDFSYEKKYLMLLLTFNNIENMKKT